MNISVCERCGARANVQLPYGPHRFCTVHFNDFFERRIKKTIRQNGLVAYGEKILVALSGGKDSMVLLHVLHKYLARTSQLKALIIDEGIAGYRDKAIAIATDYCRQLDVSFVVVSHKNEFGVTNNQIAPLIATHPELGKSVCSFCGTFRKSIMNRYAKKLGAAKLATGHNLDDEAQSVIMNVLDNHASKLASLDPMAQNIQTALAVPRIKPLYDTPEKDIITYAALNRIPHYANECCPHSFLAKRNDARFHLNQLEQKYPGTKHSVVQFLKSVSQTKRNPKKLSRLCACTSCGEPAASTICQACDKKHVLQKALQQKNEKTKIKKQTDSLTCTQTKRM